MGSKISVVETCNAKMYGDLHALHSWLATITGMLFYEQNRISGSKLGRQPPVELSFSVVHLIFKFMTVGQMVDRKFTIATIKP